MANTTAADVIDSFESSFVDKHEIPESLEKIWLLKAIGKFSNEIDQLYYDEELNEFNAKLDRYTIDTLAEIMKVLYEERQVSLVNKRVSIVGKDLSIDGSNGSKQYTAKELDYVAEKVRDMIENQKPTAYL